MFNKIEFFIDRLITHFFDEITLVKGNSENYFYISKPDQVLLKFNKFFSVYLSLDIF